LVVGAGGGILLAGDDGDGGPSPRTLAAKVDAPGAHGTLELAGSHAELNVAGMPVPPRDRVYQEWIKRHGAAGVEPTDRVFSVTKGPGTGSVTIPDVGGDVDAIMVTAEPVGGSTSPTLPPVVQVAV